MKPNAKTMIVFTMVLLLCGIAAAQNGLYGTFILGQKFIKMDAMDAALAGNAATQGVDVPNNFFTIGGEGHMIVAKHLAIGGKGSAFGYEKKLDADATYPRRAVRVSGGIGLGTLGFALPIHGNSLALNIIPQLGLGLAPLVFQYSDLEVADTATTFDQYLTRGNDGKVDLVKVGPVVDVCLGGDLYLKVIRMLSIIPGLETGLLIHAEVGWAQVLGNTKWVRDLEELDSFEPDVDMTGTYVNVGIGLALTTKDE